jgi:diguanylate cyclase (GGDEF)-like protein/PAS domain S-box-containing protein
MLNGFLQGHSSYARHRRLLFFSALYIVSWWLTWYSAAIFDRLGVVSLWFLPAGLRFFCLFLLGRTGLVLELVNALVLLLVQLALSMLGGGPAIDGLGAIYNLFAFPLAYATAILPLRWLVKGQLDFKRPQHGILFICAALCASTLAATAGVARLLYTGVIAQAQWLDIFTSWFTGDFIGIVTLAPFLLVLAGPRVQQFLQQGRWTRARRPQSAAAHSGSFLLILAMVVGALWVVSVLPRLSGVTQQSPLFALLLLLPLAAVALRFGLAGSVLVVFLLDCGLVALVTVMDQRDIALQYQLVMVAIALVGVWMGGTVEAHKHIVAKLSEYSAASSDLLWEADANGSLQISGHLSPQIGLASGAVWRSLLASVEQPHLAELEKALQTRRPFAGLNLALRRGAQDPLWVRVNGLPQWNAADAFVGYRGTATDISDAVRVKMLTELHSQDLAEKVAQRTEALDRANAELANKEQHLRVLLTTVPVGVLELDADGKCDYLNDKACALSGLGAGQAQGLHLLDFVHPDDRERVGQEWSEKGQAQSTVALEFQLNLSNIWCMAYWLSFPDLNASPVRTMVVLADATLQHQQAKQLWAMAHTDLLTGLPNRSLFLDRCAQALTLARRQEAGVAVLCIDLDGLKAVNDSLGHSAGDALLQQVAPRLRARVRDSDTVARMGGDEFGVVLVDIGSALFAEQVATALLASLSDPFALPQGSVRISASIGIAYFPHHGADVEKLMGCADMAMYNAKRAGKNQSRVWSQDMVASLEVHHLSSPAA